ncbi:MAG: AtpZ/AtpI family protein [Verrucomicrobia bacterium]|nr:AtpZ/AtpI family protein [Verrucomicrobiota bacterium]MBS0636113.1 AtpZ/AtpI family protein [Verrucomicrobiota bacterium]
MKPNDSKKRPKQSIAFALVPFILAVPPIVGWFIGSYLDGLLGTSPWIMYFLVVLGLVAGIRELYRIIQEFGE